MEQTPERPHAAAPDSGLTAKLAVWASSLKLAGCPPDVRLVAKQAILDWLGVALAGQSEQAVQAIRSLVQSEGGVGQASLIDGSGEKVTARQAAMLNGAAGHVLDYDDLHRAMRGHPTGPMLPALLALAELSQSSGEDLLTAFIAGFEVQCRIGKFMGDSHYDDGWHSTATIGAVGAAAGCARLLGFSPSDTANAISLAATQASGLKVMFGTMAKCFHVGKAAEVAVTATLLTKLGLTCRSDALEAVQGLGHTQSRLQDAETALDGLGANYFLPGNLFKYLACCYGLHAVTHAAILLRDKHGLRPEDIESVELFVAPHTLGTCNIQAPHTALESKFSMRFTVAMALSGLALEDPATYTSELVARPDLIALSQRVTVTPLNSFLNSAKGETVIRTLDGGEFRLSRDMGEAASDLEEQTDSLRRKFHALARPILGEDQALRVEDVVFNIESRNLEDLIRSLVTKKATQEAGQLKSAHL